MRSVLIGAVESSRVALQALASAGVPPLAVFTLPESRAHRHSDWVDLRPVASGVGVPVVEVLDINDPDILRTIEELVPDVAFVIGWSQICRAHFLAIPRIGAVGYHPAPLPENRGRAVIPWTILQGRTDTAGTLFWMDAGMDSGDILAQESFPVAPDETAGTLYQKHMGALERMLGRAIPWIREGDVPRLPQDPALATYCARRRPADSLVDWDLPAAAVWTLIRATGHPYPGAFSFDQARKLTIWEAQASGPGPYWGLPGQVQVVTDSGALVQCGDGNHVLLQTVQRDGEPPRRAADVLRTHQRLGIDWASLMATTRGASP